MEDLRQAMMELRPCGQDGRFEADAGNAVCPIGKPLIHCDGVRLRVLWAVGLVVSFVILSTPTLSGGGPSTHPRWVQGGHSGGAAPVRRPVCDVSLVFQHCRPTSRPYPSIYEGPRIVPAESRCGSQSIPSLVDEVRPIQSGALISSEKSNSEITPADSWYSSR